jgi:uncharacterized protein (DUF952 family)
MSNSSWAIYLARGAPKVIYHLCLKDDYTSALHQNREYFPPTFVTDGSFIHATEDPSFLLYIGNHFYKSSSGNWVCLKLNPSLVGGPVVYEEAAPVGNIPAFSNEKIQKFPHIYGGIPEAAVIKEYPIIRDSDGQFIEITGLYP